MNKTSIYYFCLFSMAVSLYGQANFQPGYLIDLKGDTIYGEVDSRGDLFMGKHCRFRKINDHDETNYTPTEVQEYRLLSSKLYVSKEIKGQKVFLEFLVKGLINLYYIRDDSNDHYFIEKGNSGILELPYKEEITYTKDNERVLQKTREHKNILIKFTKEVPELRARINKLGAPVHENLIPIVEYYHNKLCTSERCIIYRKKTSLLKFDIECGAGLVSIKQVFDVRNSSNPTLGILANIWMPRGNEKLYLRTGLIWNTSKSNNIYKFPVQLQYIHPKGILRPKIAYGMNIYRPFFHSVSMMGGANIHVHKNIFASMSCDIDFIPKEKIPLFPTSSLLSSSLLIGIYIKL